MLIPELVTILWVAVAWRATPLRQEPWKRALWVVLAGLAIALTTDIAPVARALDQASGITDLATLVKHLSGMAAWAALLDWVITLNPPTAQQSRANRAAMRYFIAIVAMAIMTSLFFQIKRHETTNFAATQGSSAVGTAYLLAFETYLGVAMVIAVRLFLPTARKTPRSLLATGLWTLAAGTGLGVLYASLRSTVLIMRLAGDHTPGGYQRAIFATDIVGAAAIALILIGTSVPAIVGAFSAVADYRALYRLHPLWWELTGVTPKIVLGTRRSRAYDMCTVRNLRGRLLRRTVEIRDSALLLRGLVEDDKYTRARAQLADGGLSGEHLDAACEAMWLHASLDAKNSSHVPTGPVRNPAPHASLDLGEEVRWLCKVADAYRDPAVRATAAHLVLEPP